MFNVKRVKKLRENLNLSETQFAKRIGVSQATYNRIEKGSGHLTADAVSQIIATFEVSPYWLLLGDGGEEPIFQKQLSETGQITISKDEFIALQRKALQQEDRIKALEKELENSK